MANILLGATGSVAAVRVPALFDALTATGHAVKVVATDAATYFFDPAAIGRSSGSSAGRNRDWVILDEDEWPRRDRQERYDRGDEEHGEALDLGRSRNRRYASYGR